MQSTDEKYMKEAIKQAKKAYAIGEVPIGCVIVYQDVCNSGTMPDVFRCDRTVPDDTGSSRMYESESRLCRLYLKSSGYA